MIQFISRWTVSKCTVLILANCSNILANIYCAVFVLWLLVSRAKFCARVYFICTSYSLSRWCLTYSLHIATLNQPKTAHHYGGRRSRLLYIWLYYWHIMSKSPGSLRTDYKFWPFSKLGWMNHTTNLCLMWWMIVSHSGPLRGFCVFNKKESIAHNASIFLEVHDFLCWGFCSFCL